MEQSHAVENQMVYRLGGVVLSLRIYWHEILEGAIELANKLHVHIQHSSANK